MELEKSLEMSWDFPDGPVVKNPPADAGDAGSIPGPGTKIPCAVGQLSLHTIREKPAHHDKRSQVPQLRPDVVKNK